MPSAALAPQAPAPAFPEFVALSPGVASEAQAEPVLETPVLDVPALPVGYAHVPFLRSAMAAGGPGASWFGNGHGLGRFAGGAFGSGGGSGGMSGGGVVSDAVDPSIETQLDGSGNERVGVLGGRAYEEASSSAGEWNNGGSNTGGPNNGGSNNGGSNGDGSNGLPGTEIGNFVAGDTEQEPGPQGSSRFAAVDVPEPGLMLLSGLGITGALVRRVLGRRR